MKIQNLLQHSLLALLLNTYLPVQASPTGDIIKIMPLGDSITAGMCDGRAASGNCMFPSTTTPTANCIDSANTGINPQATGYRPYLKQILSNAGLWSQFVGSMGAFDQPPVFNDHMHEGHGGWKISDIGTCASEWVKNAKPDIVLLHIGTNDAVSEITTASQMINHLNILIKNIYSANPNIRLIVGQIIPNADPIANSKIFAYNNYIKNDLTSNFLGKNLAIAGMNAYNSNNSNPLEQLNLADLSSGQVCDATAPTNCVSTSGIHPTSAGYQKMALAWASAIQSQIQQIETITANGKYWLYPDSTYTTPLSAPLNSVPRYAMMCNGLANCKIDTYAFWGNNTTSEIESITGYGFAWNFDANKLTPISSTSLNSVPRYNYHICAGRTPCIFDTRAFRADLVRNYFGEGSNYVDGISITEAITAYGSYWDFDSNGTLIASGNLSTTSKYSAICASKNPCTFDTRTYVTIGNHTIESITAYGNYWNFDLSGNLLQSGSINNIPRYASICQGANPCKFDTRTFWSWSYR